MLTSSLRLLTASRQQSSSYVTALRFREGQSSGRSSSRILKTSTTSSRVMDFITTASPTTPRCTLPLHGRGTHSRTTRGSRRLQLNAAKTEVIWFGSEFERLPIRRRQSNRHRQRDNSTCRKRCDLGVYLDSELNMQAHITKTTQACFFRLRQIRCLFGSDVSIIISYSFDGYRGLGLHPFFTTL